MQQPPQNPSQEPSNPYQQQPQPVSGTPPPPPQYTQYDPTYVPQPQQPYTQYQQPMQTPQPPKKKRGPLFWILTIVGAIIVLSLAICALVSALAAHSVTTSVNNAVSTVDTASTTVANTSSSSNTSNGQISKVGGTITLDGVQTTLVSVKTSPGGQYDTPKPGNEYVIVHVKLHNTGSQEHNYNGADFHIKSGTGNITQQDYISTENSSDLLNYGTLSAGGTAEGDLVFQVKQGDHKAELTWQPSFFQSAGDNGWNLGL